MRLRGSVPNPGMGRAMFVISGVEKPILMLHDGQSRLLVKLALISLQWEPVRRCYACTGNHTQWNMPAPYRSQDARGPSSNRHDPIKQACESHSSDAIARKRLLSYSWLIVRTHGIEWDNVSKERVRSTSFPKCCIATGRPATYAPGQFQSITRPELRYDR